MDPDIAFSSSFYLEHLFIRIWNFISQQGLNFGGWFHPFKLVHVVLPLLSVILQAYKVSFKSRLDRLCL